MYHSSMAHAFSTQPLCLHIYNKHNMRETDCFLYKASPQQGDLRLSGLPPGQGAGGGARTRDRRVPADLRADSLATCHQPETDDT
ncbi:hypothetical protein PoB_003012500 [Plakobranchus ocellatus]|uniref:Uncharacterized protein n=1 Tax=Plakobranchus ocellatus TaxID=259542 RepID=A0AAV4A8C6_9GAST|nr:hypothetical protein PoB_003012500 [Plakobranchus ocellatus]